jgi:glycerophosphoryl diester phosphodiesterase
VPREPLDPGRPLAIAHRFGNEPRLVRGAVEAGADLVELDIWPYRGKLEVRHLKTMGPVPLLWDRKPYRLVSARAPRLELSELLDGHERGELMLDLKGRDVAASVAVRDEMRSLQPGAEYTVCSQSWTLLETFRDEPGVRVVHSVGSELRLRSLERRLPAHATGVGVNVRLLTRERVQRLRELVPLVATWRVNDADTLDRVLDWGVTAVITDSLHIVRALRARTP